MEKGQNAMCLAPGLLAAGFFIIANYTDSGDFMLWWMQFAGVTRRKYAQAGLRRL